MFFDAALLLEDFFFLLARYFLSFLLPIAGEEMEKTGSWDEKPLVRWMGREEVNTDDVVGR